MNKTNKVGFFFLLSVVCVILVSCSKSRNSSQNPAPGNSEPSIISINPLMGGVNTVVTIKGNNFSNNGSSNIVKFNGTIANILFAKTDTLIVVVPAGASTGPVTVTVNNKTTTGQVFSVFTTLLVTTLAGTGNPGHVDGINNIAQFNYPYDICMDVQGNIYVSDYNQIRKITTTGLVSTLAGSGIRGFLDGPGNIAQFNPAMGIAVDAQGNIYVADRDNQRIRKVAPDGTVSTFAGSGMSGYQDGVGANTKFWEPLGVAVNAQGFVYVADRSNYRVRKIAPDGTVSTLAGKGVAGYADGTGVNAEFYNLQDIAVDTQGNVFVTDQNRIRKISPTGVVTTFAGSGNNNFLNGTGLNADFANPNGLCIDGQSNIYVGDETNAVIRKINTLAFVSTFAGTPVQQGFADGPALTAKFYFPKGVAADAQGNVYVADNANHRIRKISYQ
jgi:sugar lactone lactonase YvrE